MSPSLSSTARFLSGDDAETTPTTGYNAETAGDDAPAASSNAAAANGSKDGEANGSNAAGGDGSKPYGKSSKGSHEEARWSQATLGASREGGLEPLDGTLEPLDGTFEPLDATLDPFDATWEVQTPES